MNDKILIAIASANEKHLKQTVQSAINNSNSPEKLVFVIFDSCLNNFPKADFKDFSNAFYINVEFDGTLGVGLSRLVASSIILPDVSYVLQIDAHMIFAPNWDTNLVFSFNQLESVAEKPVISLRSNEWSLDQDGKIIYNNIYNRLQKLVFSNFKDTAIKSGYPTIEGVSVSDEEYIEHSLISAGFTFSRPDLYTEILHDPRLVWGGDEAVYALRAWSRGYRMFSIKTPICFHYNKKIMKGAYGKGDPDDWRELKNNDPRLFPFYMKRYNDGKRIMREILLGEYVGYWGAPSVEKLKEFELTCGINFKDFYDIVDKNA